MIKEKVSKEQFESIVSVSSRVVVIGPVLPYRGGIAQHTTMLSREIRKQADCLTISFSRQYPSWLYPGKNDRDESIAGNSEENVEYLIDSTNPLSWAKAVKRVRAYAPRMVVIHWWHVYWTACFSWICRQLKKDNIEIVFLCHNAVDHEEAYWKLLLSNFALSYANRFVVHAASDKAKLQKRYTDIPVNIHPMPVFDNFPAPAVKLPHRAKLELLFFGFVRPYKGLDILLKSMISLKNEDVFLSIIGEFWNGEDEAKDFVLNHGLNDKVEIISRYVSDAEAANYFDRCDVVVLPYRSATGSAVIPLAYHYGKPVIATKVGGLPDVVLDGKTGIIIAPGSISQIITSIKRVMNGEVNFDKNSIAKIKKHLAWPDFVKTVLLEEPNTNSNLNIENTEKLKTHAILDTISRENKAKKIQYLSKLDYSSESRKILEIGTGSGLIAFYFSKLSGNDVHAIDVFDERQVHDGFQFQLVKGTLLPFDDLFFDFIISNHVVEHVGDFENQENHINEIYRCLKSGGTLYFSVPNRWRLIEPHYKLPFLSWLPQNIASFYVRLFKLGDYYDCNPLSQREVKQLLEQAGFMLNDVTLDAISVVGNIEGGWFLRQLTALPKWFWRLFTPIMPTLIFVCRKPIN